MADTSERYLVLAGAMATEALGSLEQAEEVAGRIVDKDRTARLIVKIVGAVKPRSAPNVDVVRYDNEASHD